MEALLRYVEETQSTNDDVMALIMADVSHGTAIYAGVQHQARGRQGRPWFSPRDRNLALSVAIVGERYAPYLPLIPLAVGVAMAELLQTQTGLAIQLKWPNDLLIDGKKIGGILCEGVQTGLRFRGAVAGVGINLNVSEDELPQELRAIATSVLIETGQELSLQMVAASARTRIVEEIEALTSGGKDNLLRRWESHDVTRGRQVEVLSTGQLGTAEGLEKDGALRVRLEDGSMLTVRSGEVHLRRPEG